MASSNTIITITFLILASGFFVLFRQALHNSRRSYLPKESRYYAAADCWATVLRSCAAVIAGINAAALHAGSVILFLAALLLSAALPRLIALRAPERTASALLPLFAVFALPLKPVYALAGIIGKRLRLFFPPPAEQPGMTEDELRHALMEGEKSGIVESKERTMVEGVFYLGDRPLGTFMTHRSDLQWLDINDPAQELREKVLEYRQQRCFPVADGALDAIIGAAYLEDIVLDFAAAAPAGLRAIMQKALFAPETMPALKSL